MRLYRDQENVQIIERAHGGDITRDEAWEEWLNKQPTALDKLIAYSAFYNEFRNITEHRMGHFDTQLRDRINPEYLYKDLQNIFINNIRYIMNHPDNQYY